MITIREANKEDLSYMKQALYKLNELHHKALPSYFKSPSEVAEAKDLSKYISSKNAFSFIALQENKHIGFAVGSIRTLSSPISKTLKIGSIEEIFIESEFRGNGIGKLLHAEIEKSCRSNGATELFTEVWGFNQPALSHYEKLGMQTHVHWLRKKL